MESESTSSKNNLSMVFRVAIPFRVLASDRTLGWRRDRTLNIYHELMTNKDTPPLNNTATRAELFIGSSTKALLTARLIADHFREKFNVTVWDENLFEPGETNIEVLLKAVQSFDFALLVLTDDDILVSDKPSSNTVHASPRDNVILELGMFYGATGRRRTFPLVIQSDSGTPKIPTDLGGMSLNFVKSHKGKLPTKNSLGKDLNTLIETIEERYVSEVDFQLLPSTGSAVGYFHNFLVPVCRKLQKETTFPVGASEVDLTKHPFEFRIVLPKSLKEANQASAEQFCLKQSLEHTSVKTAHRTFPFWIQPSMEDDKLVFWDYPTALKSSDEAVQYVSRGSYLMKSALRDALESKELRNFERTLQLLLDTTSDGALVKDLIRIVREKY